MIISGLWVRGRGEMIFHKFSPRLSSFRPVETAFENFWFCLDVKEGMFLLLCLLCFLSIVCSAMFGVRTGISGRAIQRSALRRNNYEYHGMWEKMGWYLEKFSAPVFWELTPEQPLIKWRYLQQECCWQLQRGATQAKASPSVELFLLKDWVMQRDRVTRCVPQGDLIFG